MINEKKIWPKIRAGIHCLRVLNSKSLYIIYKLLEELRIVRPLVNPGPQYSIFKYLFSLLINESIKGVVQLFSTRNKQSRNLSHHSLHSFFLCKRKNLPTCKLIIFVSSKPHILKLSWSFKFKKIKTPNLIWKICLPFSLWVLALFIYWCPLLLAMRWFFAFIMEFRS